MHCTVSNTHLTIAFQEALTGAQASALLTPLLQHLGDARQATALAVDLTGVRELDSAGVALLLGLFRHARQAGWAFEVTAAAPEIGELLQLCKVGRWTHWS